MDVPRVLMSLGSRHFVTSTVEIDPFQPPKPRTPDIRYLHGVLIQRSSCSWIQWFRFSSSPLRTSRLRELEHPTLALSSCETLRSDIYFPSRVLATRNFASQRFELSCSYPANPRDARSQRSIDSLLQGTLVRLSIMRDPP
jgi:hypothetical protein